MSTAIQSTTRTVLPPLLRSTAGKLPHALSVETVVHSFGIDPAMGLSSIEFAEHQAHYGPNSIQSIRPRPAWRLLVDADVVLADDNFETIVRAIEGGPTIYANIGKFVHMMFSHNLAEVVMIFTAIVLGWPLTLLPLQILWMNLATDVFPALALAVEPPSAAVMKQRPQAGSLTTTTPMDLDAGDRRGNCKGGN